MSATAKPARLWLKPASNRGAAVWHIKHEKLPGGRRSTGCGESDREGAERELAQYIAANYQPRRPDTGDPGQILLSEALGAYFKTKTVKTDVKAANVSNLRYRIDALLDYFGRMTLADLAKIRKTVGASYTLHRGSRSAARRELEDLGAALKLFFDEDDDSIVVKLPKIELPAKSKPRERYLTRDEAARLIRAAWRYREIQKGQQTDRASRQHVARFILVGLYTGTRSGAICGAALTPAIGRGFVDLERGVFYRRGLGDPETNKRQPTADIHERLLAHMRRWRDKRISNQAVIEFGGEPVKSVKKAFKRAVAEAGLETSGINRVTPHTLRHTGVSWAKQKGIDTERICEFFGMTPAMVRNVYFHGRDTTVGDALTGWRGKRAGGVRK